MFGEGMRLAERCVYVIPGPQAKQRRKDMLRGATLSGKLEGPGIRMLHLLNAPTLCRPQGVAERYLQLQFHLAAEQGVIDMRNLPQALLQMTNSFAVRRTRGRLFPRHVPVTQGLFVAPRLRVVMRNNLGMGFGHFGKTLLEQRTHSL